MRKAEPKWKLVSPTGVVFNVPDHDVVVGHIETPVASCDDPSAEPEVIRSSFTITITMRSSDPQVG